MSIVEVVIRLLIMLSMFIGIFSLVFLFLWVVSPQFRKQVKDDFNKKPPAMDKKALIVAVSEKDVIINCPACNCCNPVKPLNTVCWNCKNPITFYHNGGEW